MLLTPDNLLRLNTRFGKEFDIGRETIEKAWPDIATRIPSTTASNTYAWMGDLPGFREWIGPRVFHNISSRIYTVTNKDWEDSYAVPRNAIEDDAYGIYTEHSRLLGNAAEMLWENLVFDTLQAGTTALGFDGQYFFDTDHPVNMDNTGAGTYSNKVTYALTPDNLDLVASLMRVFVGEGGRSLSLRPDTLIVPPQLAALARAAMAPVIGVSGAAIPNPYVSGVGGGLPLKLVVADRLSNQPTIYYLASTKRLKPIVLQVRKEPVFQARTEPTMDNVFLRKEFEYGSDARGNCGYGLPFTVMRVATA